MTWDIDDILAARPVEPALAAAAAEDLRQELRSARLRELRAEQGVTQVQLADQLHVSQNRVSEIERGQIGKTQVDTLRRYIEALGGTLSVEANWGDTRYVIA